MLKSKIKNTELVIIIKKKFFSIFLSITFYVDRQKDALKTMIGVFYCFFSVKMIFYVTG